MRPPDMAAQAAPCHGKARTLSAVLSLAATSRGRETVPLQELGRRPRESVQETTISWGYWHEMNCLPAPSPRKS